MSSLATTWSYLPNSGDRRLAGVATAGLGVGQSTAFAFTTNAGHFITGQTETSAACLPRVLSGCPQADPWGSW